MKKKILTGGIICVVVVIFALLFFLFNKDDNTKKYKEEKITKGNIKAQVTATGIVNAVTTVLVGTQISGTIKQIYVDYNSPVKIGQILALIDPETLSAQVEQTKANLLSAEAQVEKGKATYLDAKRTLERNKTLFAKNFISKSDLDTSDTNYQTSYAQLLQATAQVEQAKSALKIADINLKNTKIISPVNGIVISRNIDVGQTVAASFQTPTLFTIAKDLTKMQIDTAVDEADIGKIKLSQRVEFSVDAYPETIFKGSVSEIRNSPTTIQNVVTYNVIIKVDNTALKLKPGMTANVYITFSEKKGVLKVPTAALRYKPQEKLDKRIGDKGHNVWVMRKGKPKRVSVTTGISEGNYIEIISSKIKEGDEIIISDINADQKNNKVPTMQPQMIR